jgi:HEAT repeat protein
LGHIGAPALLTVLNALTNKSYKISLNAMEALPYLGTNVRPAIPLLLRELDNLNPNYRTRSAAALASLQIDAETLLPVFLKLLQDPYPAVRSWAVTGLTQLGPKARPAAASLLAMMENEEDRRMARDALIKIAPDMLAHPSAK